MLNEAGIRSLMSVQNGIEVIVRQNLEAAFYFLLNHTDEQKMFLIDQDYINLLTGRAEAHLVETAPKDVKILKKKL